MLGGEVHVFIGFIFLSIIISESIIEVILIFYPFGILRF